jgi:hypothetical protein
MSFLFPQRTYRRIANIYRQIDPNVSLFEEDERDKKTFYGFGWIRSFIPGTQEFLRRKLLGMRIVKLRAQLKSAISDKYPNASLYRTFLETVAFPSWRKTIFLLLSMLLMLGVTLMGLGALLQILGVSTGPFGFLMFHAISTLAMPFSLSAFNFSIIAMAVGAFFASLSFEELDTPGSIFKFVGLFPQNLQFVPITQKFDIPIIGLIPVLESVVGFLKAANIKEKKERARDLLEYLNPASFILIILTCLTFAILKLIDLGSNEKNYHSFPRMFLKGLILAPLTILRILLGPIIKLLDLPIDFGYFLYKKYIASADDVTEDIQEKSKQNENKPIIVSTNSKQSLIQYIDSNSQSMFEVIQNVYSNLKVAQEGLQMNLQQAQQQYFQKHMGLVSYQAESDAYIYMLKGGEGRKDTGVSHEDKGQDRVATGVIENFQTLNPVQPALVMQNTFDKIQSQLNQFENSGACGLICIVDEVNHRIITGNAGDSIGFCVIRDADKNVVSCKLLNRVHNVHVISDEEVNRVNEEKSKDAPVFSREQRLSKGDSKSSSLSVVRCFANTGFKKLGLSSKPEVSKHTLKKEEIPLGGDAFVVTLSHAFMTLINLRGAPKDGKPFYQFTLEGHLKDVLNQLTNKDISVIAKGLVDATINRIAEIPQSRIFFDDASCIVHPINFESGKVTYHAVINGNGKEGDQVAEKVVELMQSTLQSETTAVCSPRVSEQQAKLGLVNH